MRPDMEILALIRSFWADAGLPPTPSARALTDYLTGPGQLQVGSCFDERTGTVWLRPFHRPRWYVDRASRSSKKKPPLSGGATAAYEPHF